MPDAGLGVRIHGLHEAVKKLGPELTAKPMRRFFEQSATVVETDAKRNAPVDTGRMRSSITHEISKARVPLWAKVGTNVHYAPYMEFGTGVFAEGDGGSRDRHWPPGGPLSTWARRHGFESGYQVARIIGKRGGLKPRRFLRNALKDNLNNIKGYLRQAGQEMAQRWGRAR